MYFLSNMVIFRYYVSLLEGFLLTPPLCKKPPKTHAKPLKNGKKSSKCRSGHHKKSTPFGGKRGAPDPVMGWDVPPINGRKLMGFPGL